MKNQYGDIRQSFRVYVNRRARCIRKERVLQIPKHLTWFWLQYDPLNFHDNMRRFFYIAKTIATCFSWSLSSSRACWWALCLYGQACGNHSIGDQAQCGRDGVASSMYLFDDQMDIFQSSFHDVPQRERIGKECFILDTAIPPSILHKETAGMEMMWLLWYCHM